MNQTIIAIVAVAVIAGAFPDQAHAAVDLVAEWSKIVVASVTPGQLAAIAVGIALVAGIGKR